MRLSRGIKVDIAFLDSRWFHILMTPRKVLYIASSVGIGGVETFLKHVSQYHSENYEPYFLLFDNGPLGHWLEENQATVFYCHHKPRLSKPWTWWLYRKELLSIVQNNNIDIVHSSMAYGALFSWHASSLCKHVWFQHGPVSGWMDRLAYVLPAKAILYNSKYTLSQQMLLSGTAAKPHDMVLPLGTPAVDLEAAPTTKNETLSPFGLREGTFILTMACRLQRWKGVHIAINAFSQLLETTKRPVALLIYGDEKWDKAYAQELKFMAKGLPVFFSRPVNDITSVFLSSDIVINCSTTPEPFGFTVIEAMACNALPIAPKSGGTREILESTLPECLFDPGNAQDLCAKLKPFLENSEHYLLTKSRSHDLFENHYTVNTMIWNLESCYSKMLL